MIEGLEDVPEPLYHQFVDDFGREIERLSRSFDRALTRKEEEAVAEELLRQAEHGQALDGTAAYAERYPDGPPYDMSTIWGRTEWGAQRMRDAERAEREAAAESEAAGESEPSNAWMADYDRSTASGLNEFAKEAAKRIQADAQERRMIENWSAEEPEAA